MAKQRKYGYRVWRHDMQKFSDLPQYEKLVIEIILMQDKFGYALMSASLMELTFMRNRVDGTNWYGFRVENFTNSGRFADALAFLNKLHGYIKEYSDSGESVLKWLELERNIGRVVYDPRVHQYVWFDELVSPTNENGTNDPTWPTWVDNVGWTRVVAPDADAARALIAKSIARSSFEKDWLELGKVVKLAPTQETFNPDFRPIEEIIKRVSYDGS